MKFRQFVVPITLASLAAAPAFASGFNIFEQGAKASGAAGAFVAFADDASAVWYNPAAMVWSETSQIQIGINFITAGGDTEFTAQDPNFQLPVSTTFEPEDSIETPFHFYYLHKSKKDSKVAWGLGINNPFGLVTKWRDRPVTFSSFDAELRTFVVNFNVAFEFIDNWSLAGGIDYMYAEVPSLSQEILVPTTRGPIVGLLDLSGEGDDFGWNLALSHRSPTFAFGLTYRSELSPDIDGNIDFENFGPISQFFPDSPASTVANLPDVLAVGVGWDLGDVNLEFDVTFTGWSTFESIDIDVINENPPFSTDLLLEEDWDDTFSYRFGVYWQATERYQWRFGAVYDETPVPAETLRPSIPDADRFGVTAGFGYSGHHWDWDFYYMALFFDDADARGDIPGVIDGTYETFVQLAGVSLNYRF